MLCLFILVAGFSAPSVFLLNSVAELSPDFQAGVLWVVPRDQLSIH